MAPFDSFDESALGAFMESPLGARGGFDATPSGIWTAIWRYENSDLPGAIEQKPTWFLSLQNYYTIGDVRVDHNRVYATLTGSLAELGDISGAGIYTICLNAGTGAILWYLPTTTKLGGQLPDTDGGGMFVVPPYASTQYYLAGEWHSFGAVGGFYKIDTSGIPNSSRYFTFLDGRNVRSYATANGLMYFVMSPSFPWVSDAEMRVGDMQGNHVRTWPLPLQFIGPGIWGQPYTVVASGDYVYVIYDDAIGWSWRVYSAQGADMGGYSLPHPYHVSIIFGPSLNGGILVSNANYWGSAHTLMTSFGPSGLIWEQYDPSYLDSYVTQVATHYETNSRIVCKRYDETNGSQIALLHRATGAVVTTSQPNSAVGTVYAGEESVIMAKEGAILIPEIWRN